ncbi:MAG: SdrD B-like domain-containing protein, partial [Phycisphaeraceae bacterium JB051]
MSLASRASKLLNKWYHSVLCQRFNVRHRQRPTHIEALEPRVLLSGTTLEGVFQFPEFNNGTNNVASFNYLQGDGSSVGVSVASAGDVNGDGYDDFLMGSVKAENHGNDSGKVVLIYGRPEYYTGDWSYLDALNASLPGSATFVGQTGSDLAGYSVSSAGDVNADGYADILISAPDSDIYDAYGKVYLIYGHQANLTGTIELSDIESGVVDGVLITGENSGDHIGSSVSGAGDVNGDGYDDFLIGAKAENDYAGKTYLIYGQQQKYFGKHEVTEVTQFPLVTDDLKGAVFYGINENDQSGKVVSSAGDVNNDGYDDFLIGASFADPSGLYSGQVYLIYGQQQSFDRENHLSDIINSSLAGAVFSGAAASQNAGSDISSAGDVNGDGFDDLLIGAAGAQVNGVSTGKVYLIYGHATNLTGDLLLSNVDNGNVPGAVFNGIDYQDNAGAQVASAGDVNADGLDDLLISAPNRERNGEGWVGQVYLIYGQAAGLSGTNNLADLEHHPDKGAVFDGEAIYSMTGMGIATAGDVNQDGYADILVAAPYNEVRYPDNGSHVYLVYGGTTSGSTLSGRAWLDANQNGLQDPDEADFAGVTVNLLNHDNQVIAQTITDENGSYSFEVLVGLYRLEVVIDEPSVLSEHDQAGDDSLDSDINYVSRRTDYLSVFSDQHDVYDIGIYNPPPTADAGLPYTIGSGDVLKLSAHGSSDPDRESLYYAWDLDGDGQFDDATGINPIITWAELQTLGFDVGQNSIGLLVTDATGITATATSTVTVNDQPLPRHIELADIVNGTVDGAAFDGENALDQSGRTVRNAGDVNGDGYDDFLIRTFIGDADSATNDTVYLIYGQEDQYTGSYSLADILDGTINGAVFTGIGPADYISIPMDGGGDVNNDGFDDIALGVYTNDTNGVDAGRVYVINGHESNLTGLINVNDIEAGTLQGSIINGKIDGDRTGYSVAWAGDVDGDDRDDLLIGSSNASNYFHRSWAGVVSLVYGSGLGTGVYDLGELTQLEIHGYMTADYNGTTVSAAGDVNGDGYDDLLMSAVGADPNGSSSGEVYLYYGGQVPYSIPISVSHFKYGMRPGAVFEGIDAGDSFGFSTDAVGDVNGDGYDDFIISSRLADEFGGQTGETYLVYGKSTHYLGTYDISGIITGQIDGAVFYGIYDNDQSGYSISGVGDVNGDGFDDLFIGSHQADPDLLESAGESYLVFGDSTALTGEILLRDLNVGHVEGLIFEGENQYDHAGISVSGAGDVNNDGYADLLIGAYQADPNELDRAGRTYLIYGGETEPLPQPDISGRVWNDVNGNGIQDESEASIAGVTVQLIDPMLEQVIQTTVTDSYGYYEFDDIVYGQEMDFYTVQYQLPENYIFSQQFQGSDRSIDSDVQPDTGTTDWFTSADNQEPLVFDAGLQAMVTISGNVQFIGPESGQIITGISTVPLDQSSPTFDVIYNSDVDLTMSVHQGVVSVYDGFGLIVNTSDTTITLSDLSEAITTSLTDSNWVYSGSVNTAIMFDLLPGVGMGSVGSGTQLLTSLLEEGETLEDIDSQSYYMRISRSVGAVDGSYQIINTLRIGNRTAQMVTTVHGSDGSIDFHVNEVSRVSAGIELDYDQAQETSGEYQLTLPTGTAPLWVNAFVDINGNGLLDEDEPYTSTQTSYADISAGLENIDLTFGVPHNATIGDQVWHDLDADGIQDDDEPAMANVTVNLLDEQNAIIATTLTDADGQYLFTDLGPGDYAVEFVAPEGYLLTVDHMGVDTALDSDADRTTGITPTITLDGQASHTDVDAGFYQPVSISGITYLDINQNDQYDEGDQLLADTTVYLDANNNGQLDWADANDNDIWDEGEGEQWALTDSLGVYRFDQLSPGERIVRQITPDHCALVLPSGQWDAQIVLSFD